MPASVVLTPEQISHVKAEGDAIADLLQQLVADIENLTSKEMLARINEVDRRQQAIAKLLRQHAA